MIGLDVGDTCLCYTQSHKKHIQKLRPNLGPSSVVVTAGVGSTVVAADATHSNQIAAIIKS